MFLLSSLEMMLSNRIFKMREDGHRVEEKCAKFKVTWISGATGTTN